MRLTIHTQFILDQPPLPIGLQTAVEPKMLRPDGPALGKQPVIQSLALLAVSREFPDERYLAGILGLRIAPLSGGADRLSMHLLVNGVTDNVEILLCQLDIGLSRSAANLAAPETMISHVAGKPLAVARGGLCR